jgi:hypothetical protein
VQLRIIQISKELENMAFPKLELFSSYLEFQAMGKVHKSNGPECYTIIRITVLILQVSVLQIYAQIIYFYVIDSGSG